LNHFLFCFACDIVDTYSRELWCLYVAQENSGAYLWFKRALYESSFVCDR